MSDEKWTEIDFLKMDPIGMCDECGDKEYEFVTNVEYKNMKNPKEPKEPKQVCYCLKCLIKAIQKKDYIYLEIMGP